MSTPSERAIFHRSRRHRRAGGDAFAYTAIALLVILSYVLVTGQYAEYLHRVLPNNDPFTYTLNWFTVIDFYRSHGYLSTLASYCFYPGNWDRLMDIGIAALAPFLSKEPYSICLVNYVLFGIATATFYRLGRRLAAPPWTAFAIALIPWIWPVNYGFEDFTSLPVLALDAAFNAALYWAVAQAYIFAFDLTFSVPGSPASLAATPERLTFAEQTRKWNVRRTASAVVTGLVIGLAVWGRGNSLPVVGLVVLWPCLMMLVAAWRSRDYSVWADFVIVGVIAGAMAAQFYAEYWHALRGYYSVHMGLVESHRSLKDLLPFILNVPGFMYWRAESSFASVALTFASHVFAFVTLVLAWRRRGPFSGPSYFAFRHLIAGGGVIYFGTYLIDMILFANAEPGFSIHQSLMVWRPMLIGLSLMLTAIASQLFVRAGRTVPRFAPAALAALVLVWGVAWTRVYTPWDLEKSWPSPRIVERFAINLDRIADNGKVAVLWYRGWNDRILTYYRLKNDLPPADTFSAADIDAIWSMTDYSEQKRARTLDQVKNVFRHASLIIMPEFLDEYASGPYYAFYRFKNDWAAWLNSEDAPRFRVLMLLPEVQGIRLLVIAREDLAQGRGDPFRLPYANRPKEPQPDYSPAVARL